AVPSGGRWWSRTFRDRVWRVDARTRTGRYRGAVDGFRAGFPGDVSHIGIWQRSAEEKIPQGAGVRRNDRMFWPDRTRSRQRSRGDGNQVGVGWIGVSIVRE